MAKNVKRTPEEINAELGMAFRRFGEEAAKATRALTVSFAAGASFGQYRRGDLTAAAGALAHYTQEERDALHAWARWLLGDEPE